jgi:hypothetical protein
VANAFITPSVIAKEALMQLKNNLVLGNLVHREYKKEFVKVGDTVSIRKPVKFNVSDGAARVNQDIEEANTSVVINKRKHVSFSVPTQDMTLTIEKFSERYIAPAALALANKIDVDGFALYKDVWNVVGTPGTTPSTFAHVAAAAQRLDEMAVPGDTRRAVFNPAAGYSLAGGQTALMNSGMVEGAYRDASIGRIAKFETYSTQNVATHTTGTKAGTPLVNGASQNVTYATAKNTNQQTLVTDGWTASSAILKQGDVFTLANVFAVNPVPGEGSKAVMPYLQQFVVKADATADGSGNATLSISPAIVTSGPYQTVSAAPADNAAITVLGTASTGYSQNLTFHKNALALVTVPLEMPESAGFKARENFDGLSIRVIKDYNIDSDVEALRMDVLYGWKTIYADLAARITG